MKIFKYTSFFPLIPNQLNGYTLKIIPRIIIASLYKGKLALDNLILNICYVVNTIIHEQCKHYIKALFHYNSLRYNISFPLESDNKIEDKKLEKLLSIVKKKKELVNINIISSDEYFEIENSDGGDIIEIYLYGQKLQRLFLKAAINFFKLKNYKNSVAEHMKSFIEDNHPFNEYINLNEEIKESPILQKIIDFYFQFSNERKSESSLLLKLDACLQISSSAEQIPGYAFMDREE